MRESAFVTKETLGEYEQTVCQMEFQREKKLAERKIAGITGGTAFFIAALSAAYGLAGLLELPVFPQLGFLAVMWKGLCAAILPDGYSLWEGILFSVLAVAVISLAVHFLTALIVGRTFHREPAAPLEGSDSEQAAGLYRRCMAAGASLPRRNSSICISMSAIYAIILLMPTLLDREKIWDNLRQMGLLMLFIVLALVAGIFLLTYAILYCICLWLSGYLYRIRRNPELEQALDTYASLYKQQELERKQAEEEHRHTEELERNRQQGDALYRQAIAGGRVDEGLIQQAADLGCCPACLYLGRQLMEAWFTGSYTREEKADIAEVAKEYFYTASLEENFAESQTEASFGYLMFQVLTESGSASKWRDVLSQLRDIRNSGNLPDRYHETCAMLIDTVVDLIDDLAAQEALAYKHPRL